MIKAILFDVDGVLVNEEKKYFTYFLEEEYGIARAKVKDFLDGEFLECVEGKKDLREVLPAYFEQWGWTGSVDALLRFWHTKEHLINEPLIEAIQSYKQSGIKVYTATNQEMYRTNYIRDDMGFGEVFDEVIASSMLGVRKPDKRYYENILIRIQQDPEHTLFWDDSEENITSAREVGLHAERYTNFLEFQKIMKDKYSL